MVFINHGRAERDAANAAERHEETAHGAVRIGEVVRLACGAMVEAADQAEGGARCQLGAGAGLQFALSTALCHAHAQQLCLVPPGHTAHGHTMFGRHQMFCVAL